MLTTLREAIYFSRNQFQPLLMIALVYALPSYLVELGLQMREGEPDKLVLALINGLFMCLSVIQFGAAIFYIDRLSQGTPIAVSKSIVLAVERLGVLLILNFLMGIAVLGGLLLMVLPGLFLAYKLLFAEFFMLLRPQDPLTALKTSYRATTGFASELLPPLLIWGSLTFAASLAGATMIDRQDEMAWATLLLHQVLMMAMSILGWTLLYRLYQKYLADGATEQA